MWLTVDESDGSDGAHTTPSGHTATKDSCTAFVSNLDYAVTAEQIREIFCNVCVWYICFIYLGLYEFACSWLFIVYFMLYVFSYPYFCLCLGSKHIQMCTVLKYRYFAFGFGLLSASLYVSKRGAY